MNQTEVLVKLAAETAILLLCLGVVFLCLLADDLGLSRNIPAKGAFGTYQATGMIIGMAMAGITLTAVFGDVAKLRL